MKALYIYNSQSSKEVKLIDQAKEQLGSYVELVKVEDLSNDLKKLVRATPALIIAPDYLQGEELTNVDVDSSLLLVAELYKNLEADEESVHNQKTNRLDNMIKIEKTKAIDDYTMELMEGGIL